MLGDIIARLDDPGLAEQALVEAGELALLADVSEAAGQLGFEVGPFIALAIRRFTERADDEAWVQLIGVIGKSETPGFAALSAILRRAVQDVRESAG
jgi:hypothetical protein